MSYLVRVYLLPLMEMMFNSRDEVARQAPGAWDGRHKQSLMELLTLKSPCSNVQPPLATINVHPFHSTYIDKGRKAGLEMRNVTDVFKDADFAQIVRI